MHYLVIILAGDPAAAQPPAPAAAQAGQAAEQSRAEVRSHYSGIMWHLDDIFMAFLGVDNI